MTRYTNPFYFSCPYYGRQWDASGMPGRNRRKSRSGRDTYGAATGFVAAASDSHVATCAKLTPAERRAANRRAEAQWKRRPPTASRIWNDPDHPGLVDKKPVDAASYAGVGVDPR